MDEELREIETKLEQMAPAAMPDDILARMEQAMERWQEFVPVEEKVIPFQAETQPKKGLRFFNVWASAAAVTLVAATSFMVLSDDKAEETVVANSPIVDEPVLASSVMPAQNIDKVIPASNAQFQTQITESSNGVIAYDAKGRPIRVMQLGFEDEVTVRDSDGRVYKVKQPRIEYYAVPVEIH